MANWQRMLDLKTEWKQAQADEITAAQLAGIISVKLSELEPFHDNYAEEWRQELISDFHNLSLEEDLSDDDFNLLMEELYTWADLPLEDKFNGKKVCWVATMI